MRISVIGSGYVGLVTAACLAEKGHDVRCVDVDRQRVDQINRKECPILEEGLDDLLIRNVGTRLIATTDLARSVHETDLSMIAVGTPTFDDAIDLRYVKQVSSQIGEALSDKKDYHVVVVKSTVIPGTSGDVVLPIIEEKSGKKAGVDFGIGMNPEFLREGSAVQDFMVPDRIVVGGIDERTRDEMSRVYACFDGVDLIRTTTKTAEMIKYAANSLLATLISFSNEIGNLCTAFGAIDVVEVMHGVHLDKRLNPVLADGSRAAPEVLSYLRAGCGYGGSCFPKDVKALIAHAQNEGCEANLLEAVVRVNERQPMEVVRLLQRHFSSFTGRRIAVLGLAFKPGTDDMRESPAIPIVQFLQARGAFIKAYDPAHPRTAREVFGTSKICYCSDLAEAVADVDAVLVLTGWAEFLVLPDLLDRMAVTPLVVDARRIYDKDRLARYEGIGLRRYETSAPSYGVAATRANMADGGWQASLFAGTYLLGDAPA